MILPDFILPSRINQHWEYSGIDSIEQCLNKKHFKSYPHKIEYRYNSRGFRDTEWPETLEELKNSIWCVGDSFTVGLGSPVEHTWSYQVGQKLNTRTINISMDGASNNWIARKAQQIIDTIGPKFLVVHWSYISRREANLDQVREDLWQTFYKKIADPAWPRCHWTDINNLPPAILKELNEVFGGWSQDRVHDEDLILMSVTSSHDEDVEHTVNLINLLNFNCRHTKVIHSFIPRFAPVGYIENLQSKISGTIILELPQLDLARDGHHYDILTAQWFATAVQELVNRAS
jgi:hypothetical protein